MTPDGTTSGNNEPTLDALLNEWECLKETETSSVAMRRMIEKQIIDFELVQRHPQGHGSKTTKSAEFKVTVKDEQKARLATDRGGWGDLWHMCHTAGLEDSEMPVKISKSIDTKKLSEIQESHPDLYFKLSDLIERYAGSPGFKVERV
jgi:hypothetical protein